MKERVGIFGGCFDPITNLHLLTAEAARVNISLDRVIFEPVSESYSYGGKSPVVSYSSRVEMIKKAVSSNPMFEVGCMDGEVSDSRSADNFASTCELLELYADNFSYKLFFICGSDVFSSMHKWRDVDKLFKQFEVIVVDRAGSEISNSVIYPNSFLSAHKNKIHRVQPYVSSDVSSTKVRNIHSSGGSVRYMVPDAVYEHIIKYDFYKTSSSLPAFS